MYILHKHPLCVYKLAKIKWANSLIRLNRSEGNFLVKKLCRFKKTLPLWKFGAVSEIACRLQKMCEAFPLALPVELSSANRHLTLSKNLAISKKLCRFKKTLPLRKKAAALASKKLASDQDCFTQFYRFTQCGRVYKCKRYSKHWRKCLVIARIDNM